MIPEENQEKSSERPAKVLEEVKCGILSCSWFWRISGKWISEIGPILFSRKIFDKVPPIPAGYCLQEHQCISGRGGAFQGVNRDYEYTDFYRCWMFLNLANPNVFLGPLRSPRMI